MMIKRLTYLWALLLVLSLTQCTTSRPPQPTAEAPPPAEEPASEPEEETPAEPVSLAELDAPETAPDDWFLLDPQEDAFPGIGVDRAYETILAGKKPQRTVVVAVIDSGVDTTHEDLRDVLWTNADEIRGNDLDDDGNGYADDIYGWSFLGGPDGENVTYDTYEVTREFIRLGRTFADVDPAELSDEERAEYEYYLEIEDAYNDKVTEAEQGYRNVSSLLMAYNRAEQVLQQHFDKAEITRDDLATIGDERQDLSTARDIFLFLDANNITKEDLVQAEEHLRSDLEYRLNLEFDPRGIVGDEYTDTSERLYGNPDVTGPDAGHGTHVAGIIAAERGNSLGIDGIADGVRIMPVRTVPDGDERDKDVANAIRYAVDNGAQIINMSFGKAFSPQKDVVDEAVRYAMDHGVLMVHGAGNDAANVDSTDNFPSKVYLDGDAADLWLTVGATSWERDDDFVAPFSNYGKQRVDLFAPGVDIVSTLPGQDYGARDGTSMAAPVVSGVAALLMAYYPDLTAAQVKEILLESATPYPTEVLLPGSNGATANFTTLSATGGVVNAYKAVQLAEEMGE